ncbi:MAG: HAD family hydrolase [Candidatus Odinarchaeota archaeon]
MRIKNSDVFIFFDDGNTLNNNKIRGKQWQQLVGEYFSPRFGGEPESWGIANVELTKDFGGDEIPKLLHENRDKSHKVFIEWFIEKWVNEMFDYVKIKRPEKKYYKEIYYDAAKYVASRVKAVFPGVIESIKILYNKGYNLFTASGSESIELKSYLKAIGIDKFFKKLYGPDLINILKVDKTFYEAIFKDLGISAKQAILIEDRPYYLNIAEKLGTNVIQACLTGKYKTQYQYFITNMKKAPQIIEEVINNNIFRIKK